MPRQVRFANGILIAFTGSVAIAVWTAVPSCERPLEIDLESPPDERPAHVDPPIRFAIAPVLSPERTVDHYHEVTSYLGARLQRRVTLVQRKTYREVNELLAGGSVHAGLICTGAYLRSIQDGDPFEMIAVPVYPEGPFYRSYLIVRAENPARTLGDLEGCRFAFSDPYSLSGHLHPLALLLRHEKDPTRYFSSTAYTYCHDGTLRAVLDGIADAGAIDSLVHDFEVRANPSLADRVRVIHVSEPLPVDPVVVSPKIDPELRDLLRQAFLSLEDSAQGRQVLQTLGILRFEIPSAEVYARAARQYEPAMRLLDR